MRTSCLVPDSNASRAGKIQATLSCTICTPTCLSVLSVLSENRARLRWERKQSAPRLGSRYGNLIPAKGFKALVCSR